tara:strand:+ start:66 stop:491 length:426 start_codon:yes stop_codon:yes gene_type:complete
MALTICIAMKTCPTCKQDKELDLFYKNRSRKDGLSRKCKSCHKKYEQELLAIAREWYAEWKSNQGCSKCGEKRPYCLDLHHTDNRRDGDGSRLISKMVASGSSSLKSRQKRILAEAKHCEVVCANCHREIHYLEKYAPIAQ